MARELQCIATVDLRSVVAIVCPLNLRTDRKVTDAETQPLTDMVPENKGRYSLYSLQLASQ